MCVWVACWNLVWGQQLILGWQPPTPRQQKGDTCPLPRSEAKGAVRGRPDPYRLPDVQGDDATRQGGTRRAVGRGLGATQWGHSSSGQWTSMELCANARKGGASPHRVGPALFHLAPQKTSEAVAGFSFRLPTPSDTPASKPFTYQAEGPCWHSRATFHTHLHLA